MVTEAMKLKKCLLLGRKAMTNLDSILKSGDITVPTEVCIVKVKVKVEQSCLTLSNPMDYAVHGFLQARILGWIAFPFSRGSFPPRDGA